MSTIMVNIGIYTICSWFFSVISLDHIINTWYISRMHERGEHWVFYCRLWAEITHFDVKTTCTRTETNTPRYETNPAKAFDLESINFLGFFILRKNGITKFIRYLVPGTIYWYVKYGRQ